MSRSDMSRADEFRQQTKEFWSKMEQRKPVAPDRKAVPTSSSNLPKKRRAGPVNPKPKKRTKKLIARAH
jgi:hypothetical protein